MLNIPNVYVSCIYLNMRTSKQQRYRCVQVCCTAWHGMVFVDFTMNSCELKQQNQHYKSKIAQLQQGNQSKKCKIFKTIKKTGLFFSFEFSKHVLFERILEMPLKSFEITEFSVKTSRTCQHVHGSPKIIISRLL